MPGKKKGLQGSCVQCGAPIPTKNVRCVACKEKNAEAERREKEGIVTIRTPSGTVEVKSSPVRIHCKLLFSFDKFGGGKLAPSATLGEFVDILFGILRAKPEYLLESDIHRHLSMLYRFRQHEVQTRDEMVLAAKLPISDLQRAIWSWVRSYLEDRVNERSHHALMLTYVIDTADFLKAHAFGGYPKTTGPMAVISPIFPESLLTQSGSGFLDQQFKGRVTRDIGHTIVLVRVPLQGRCVKPLSNEVRIPSDTQFLFQIQRCHLSTAFQDYIDLEAVDDAEPQIYLSHDFKFFGDIIVPRPDDYGSMGRMPADLMSSLGAPTSTNSAKLEIPIRWISHVLERGDPDMVLTPVPEWTP